MSRRPWRRSRGTDSPGGLGTGPAREQVVHICLIEYCQRDLIDRLTGGPRQVQSGFEATKSLTGEVERYVLAGVDGDGVGCGLNHIDIIRRLPSFKSSVVEFPHRNTKSQTLGLL